MYVDSYSRFFRGTSFLEASTTLPMYDSIERGTADECERVRGRRSRTFTLTHLLVACGAACVCAIAATTVVNTKLANFVDDSAIDDDAALANFDDDFAEEAQLGFSFTRKRRRGADDPGTAKEKKCIEQVSGRWREEKVKCDTRPYSERGLCLAKADDERGKKTLACKKKYGSSKSSAPSKSSPPSESSPPSKSSAPTSYVKQPMPTVMKARCHASTCACPRQLNYGSSGIKACEEKCNQCDKCVGFKDVPSRQYCLFSQANGDWYVKPN